MDRKRPAIWNSPKGKMLNGMVERRLFDTLSRALRWNPRTANACERWTEAGPRAPPTRSKSLRMVKPKRARESASESAPPGLASFRSTLTNHSTVQSYPYAPTLLFLYPVSSSRLPGLSLAQPRPRPRCSPATSVSTTIPANCWRAISALFRTSPRAMANGWSIGHGDGVVYSANGVDWEFRGGSRGASSTRRRSPTGTENGLSG